MKQVAQACCADELWQDEPDVLSGQSLNKPVKEERQIDGIDKEEPIPEAGSSNESDYRERTHDDVGPLIRGAHEQHERKRLARLIYDRFKNVVLALIEEPQKPARGNFTSPVLEGMNQDSVKAFLPEEAKSYSAVRYTSFPSPKTLQKVLSDTS